MEIARIGRVLKIGNSVGVVLPVELTRGLNIRRGDLVTFAVLSETGIVIRKLLDREVKALTPTDIPFK